jgi:uncharacterized protein YdeI (YjbR/CyaY-like superfamily)
VTWKKSVATKYVSTSEVLDEQVCFGWVDGLRRKLDQDRTMQLISPRRTQRWAQTYKVRAARLQRFGQMHQSGLNSIKASNQQGLWNATREVDALVVPKDLKQALKSQDSALTHFELFAPSYRRNILRWLKLAMTQKTRDKRLALIAMTSLSKC